MGSLSSRVQAVGGNRVVRSVDGDEDLPRKIKNLISYSSDRGKNNEWEINSRQDRVDVAVTKNQY